MELTTPVTATLNHRVVVFSFVVALAAFSAGLVAPSVYHSASVKHLLKSKEVEEEKEQNEELPEPEKPAAGEERLVNAADASFEEVEKKERVHCDHPVISQAIEPRRVVQHKGQGDDTLEKDAGEEMTDNEIWKRIPEVWDKLSSQWVPKGKRRGSMPPLPILVPPPPPPPALPVLSAFPSPSTSPTPLPPLPPPPLLSAVQSPRISHTPLPPPAVFIPPPGLPMQPPHPPPVIEVKHKTKKHAFVMTVREVDESQPGSIDSSPIVLLTLKCKCLISRLRPLFDGLKEFMKEEPQVSGPSPNSGITAEENRSAEEICTP
ncbi:hypothetical protein BT69DRAFT_1109077 [Atractiella rhizophila]|nr:hypothetical protein BT69DRAFT_1109077 [Atractiella rhizophila]